MRGEWAVRIKGIVFLFTCLTLFACETQWQTEEEFLSERGLKKSFTEFSSVSEVQDNTTSFADCLKQTAYETIDSFTYENWMASRQLCATACKVSDDLKRCPNAYLNQGNTSFSCEEYMKGSRLISEKLNEKRQALAFECQKALFRYNELVTQNMPEPLFPLSECITYWLRFDIPKERLEEFTNCDIDVRHIKRGSFDNCLQESRSVLGALAEHSKMMRICWPTIKKEEKTCQNLEKLRSYDITKEDLAALKQNCI